MNYKNGGLVIFAFFAYDSYGQNLVPNGAFNFLSHGTHMQRRLETFAKHAFDQGKFHRSHPQCSET